ncbi:hypothetical protein EAVNNN508_00576 [Elizabethkingia anophelis]|nr:hypothetical protein [Elizabethkingia anophelis]MDV4030719.1 hypothetical protein [Elizabethkingia anophelis]CAH1144004.1 hypothetical protein EAVNVB490_01585 [Elizabethkingia anophelis]CAI9670510.1 hypothetical protein EAVNNN508_01584 [Elizabethkingia anophelis]CAI9673214.1 hypothetical protein EAVNVB490_00578 [Elizabethkingia anophelis]
MKLLSSIFQTKMFLVTLILLIIYSFIIAPTGFNRTISWGEFDKLIYFTKTYFQIILIFYLSCYGTLTLIKRKTNEYISMIHTVITLISMLLLKQQAENVFGLFSVLSFVCFLINIVFSLKIVNS